MKRITAEIVQSLFNERDNIMPDALANSIADILNEAGITVKEEEKKWEPQRMELIRVKLNKTDLIWNERYFLCRAGRNSVICLNERQKDDYIAGISLFEVEQYECYEEKPKWVVVELKDLVEVYAKEKGIDPSLIKLH